MTAHTAPTAPVRMDADWYADACRLGELLAAIRVWVESLDEYPQYITPGDAMDQVRRLIYRHDADTASSTTEEQS